MPSQFMLPANSVSTCLLMDLSHWNINGNIYEVEEESRNWNMLREKCLECDELAWKSQPKRGKASL